MKINPGRKDRTSIMNHQGFGELVIIKNGARVTIPQTCIHESGKILKSVRARLDSLTIENVKVLESRGVKCELNIESKAE